MRKLILIFLFISASAWGRTCTSRANGLWSATGNGSTTGTWSNNGGTNTCNNPVPGTLGNQDTVIISSAVTQDIANLVIGVNGAAPERTYLSTLTGSGPAGGGTGYTGCSIAFSGGTLLGNSSSGVGCTVVGNGVITPYITDRGYYATCPIGWTITPTGGGSGATLSGTPTCVPGGGVPAVSVANIGTAILTIAADTYVRGDLAFQSQYALWTVALIISPGATLYMDMTQSSGAMYTLNTGDSGGTRGLSANCASNTSIGPYNNGCSIQGYGGVTTINSITAYVPQLTLNNVYLKYVGDANTAAIKLISSSGASVIQDVENSVFDTCGTTIAAANITNSIFIWSGNYHLNTPIRFTGDVLMPNLNPSAAGQYNPARIVNNAFDGSLNNGLLGNNGVGVSGAVVTGNVFTNSLIVFGGGASLFQDNFLRWYAAPDQNGNGQGYAITSSIYNTYAFPDGPYYNNPHFLDYAADGMNINNVIADPPGVLSSGDVQWFSDSNNTYTNNLLLCMANGAGSWLITGGLPSTPTVHLTNITHNTHCGSKANMYVNHNAAELSGGMIFESNLMWSATTGTDIMKIYVPPGTVGTYSDRCTCYAWDGTIGAGGTNCTKSNCDYNSAYNYNTTQVSCPGCTNSGRGYGGLWSGMPGYHDVDNQNPGFVDNTRKLANFDTGYLGKSTATAWSAGTTYNYGDIVSNSDPNMYGGGAGGTAGFNFRCINASGCTNAEAPGVAYRSNYIAGSSSSMTVTMTASHMPAVYARDIICGTSNSAVTVTSFTTSGSPVTSVTINYASTAGVTCYVISEWRTNWEWASIYWLRALTYSKASYTDSAISCTGCTVIQALNNWVRAGWIPTNGALLGAGHDGSNIGVNPYAVGYPIPIRHKVTGQ